MDSCTAYRRAPRWRKLNSWSSKTCRASGTGKRKRGDAAARKEGGEAAGTSGKIQTDFPGILPLFRCYYNIPNQLHYFKMVGIKTINCRNLGLTASRCCKQHLSVLPVSCRNCFLPVVLRISSAPRITSFPLLMAQQLNPELLL